MLHAGSGMLFKLGNLSRNTNDMECSSRCREYPLSLLVWSLASRCGKMGWYFKCTTKSPVDLDLLNSFYRTFSVCGNVRYVELILKL